LIVPRIARGDRALVDTGLFVGLHNSADEHRDEASDLYDALLESGIHLVTSDYVLDEAVTFAACKAKRKDIAVDIGTTLLTTTHVKLHQCTGPHVLAAWESFKKYDDQGLSFTDCMLLAICRLDKIPILVTFDSDFDGVGDGPLVIHSEADLRGHL
jgi:hypothetical protein